MSENFWDKLMGDDEHAATYMISYSEGPGSPLRHKIGSYLESEDWVLDVGCGPGHNFDHFLQHGPSVYYRGMDYSERFVRVANERVKPMKIFKLGDVRKIPEPDKSFDVVIFQDVLEHTNGYEKPLEEALRVARKRVIVTFWHLMDKEEDNPINDDGDDGWGAWYSRPKWEKYLDSLGLNWKHEDIPRKGEKHDVYIIEAES
jgi:ubiquinone/menaquinone biosynthesis C-methylase UbiE